MTLARVDYLFGKGPKSIERVMTLAQTAHKGQVDKSGEPYFSGHLIRVAEAVSKHMDQRAGDYAIKLAFLHDIVEDTHVRLIDIAKMYGMQVATDVGTLTRDTTAGGETYMQYIAQLCETGTVEALLVKKCDLEDHLRQVPGLTIPDSLAERYTKALDMVGAAYKEKRRR
jgi:(p)ppGpp synthase/HD superfamily hydrolase|tara:strand:+ start:12895 stop:13404 length:510 start_codon:yes stop_codon:yes gene_type:complete